MSGRNFVSDEELHSEILETNIDLEKEGEVTFYKAHPKAHAKTKKIKKHKHTLAETTAYYSDTYNISTCTQCGKYKRTKKDKNKDSLIVNNAKCTVDECICFLTDYDKKSLVYLNKNINYNLYNRVLLFNQGDNGKESDISNKSAEKLFVYGLVSKSKTLFTSTIIITEFGKKVAERILKNDSIK